MDDVRRGEITRRGVFGLLGAAVGAAGVVTVDGNAAAASPSPEPIEEQPARLAARQAGAPPAGPFPDATLVDPTPAPALEQRPGDDEC